MEQEDQARAVGGRACASMAAAALTQAVGQRCETVVPQVNHCQAGAAAQVRRQPGHAVADSREVLQSGQAADGLGQAEQPVVVDLGEGGGGWWVCAAACFCTVVAGRQVLLCVCMHACGGDRGRDKGWKVEGEEGSKGYVHILGTGPKRNESGARRAGGKGEGKRARTPSPRYKHGALPD